MSLAKAEPTAAAPGQIKLVDILMAGTVHELGYIRLDWELDRGRQRKIEADRGR